MFTPFSKRARQEQGKGPDAYKYDELPDALKNQIIHICNELIAKLPKVFFRGGEAFFAGARQALFHELGLLRLTNRPRTAEEDVWNFFLQQQSVETCLDIIEIVFACVVAVVQGDPHVHAGFGHELRQAADEINARFKEHSIGYEFREGRFIRIDSGFLHGEAVAPVMALLRHRRFGECINECLKAFESTMKAICDKRGWSCNQTDTAKKLLAVCEQNGLFPAYMQSSLSGLRSVLESVPTTRNKLSGHGQGTQQIQITEDTAAFVIHSAASNILFLAEREKQLP
jgi:hypothetical protein